MSTGDAVYDLYSQLFAYEIIDFLYGEYPEYILDSEFFRQLLIETWNTHYESFLEEFQHSRDVRYVFDIFFDIVGKVTAEVGELMDVVWDASWLAFDLWDLFHLKMQLKEYQEKFPSVAQCIEPVSSTTPEDKVGPLGVAVSGFSGLQKYVKGDEAHAYRIDFWNHESATAPAQEVFILDTLDVSLDDSSLDFVGVGFREWSVPLEGGQYFNVDVDLRPTEDLIVNVEGKYDPDQRAIGWTFRSLDPQTGELPDDPMAGFLPPITDTGHEVGWVDIAIDQSPGLSTGTVISNQAFVNFDGQPNQQGIMWAPAPKEGPWINTIDADVPWSTVDLSSLEQHAPTFPISLAGEDDENGCGIARYRVYFSDDGADFQHYLTTAEPQFTFEGEFGHTYRFYSIAEDHVGNREAPPEPGDYDAITTIVAPRVMAVAPSPFVPSRGHSQITFFGEAVPNAKIQIFDKAGDLIQTIREPNGDAELSWNVRSRSGDVVASGVYIWVLETPSGKQHQGKFAIIR